MDVEFERHLSLVRSLVSRYRSEYSEDDDLFQVGCIGLIKALKGFDSARGISFATYAVPVIAGEIKMYLRGQGPLKYSRALKTQALRIKRLQAELEQRLGRAPSIGELADAAGLSREELLIALDALRLPLALDAGGSDKAVEFSASGGEEEVVDRLALREALASLPSRERQIVHCRFFEHRSQREVAELLGISQVHVSRLEKKVMRDLKELLAE